jgi:hypothetical protein
MNDLEMKAHEWKDESLPEGVKKTRAHGLGRAKDPPKMRVPFFLWRGMENHAAAASQSGVQPDFPLRNGKSV